MSMPYQLYARVTGRKVPIPHAENEPPPLPNELIERHTKLKRLLYSDDFHEFLDFARERASGVLDGKKAGVATELELRAAKSGMETVQELGLMIWKFIEEIEKAMEDRNAWLSQSQPPSLP